MSELELAIESTSRAADGGYLALLDISEIAAALQMEYRVIGGHMVTLLTALHGVSEQVPMRETVDADLGALPQVISDPRLPQALRDRGYAISGAANRFVRHRDDARGRLGLVIDILAPSYQGKLQSNRRHGELFVDEVPGLAFALSRPPTTVGLRVCLLGGVEVTMRLALPDLTSALCLKALAYRGRLKDKDAVDLWRLVSTAHAAGLRAAAWPTTVTGRDAGEVLQRFFGRSGAAGLQQMSARRGDQTRMRAMVRAVVAHPAGR